jgi:hypothetical protein
MRVNEFVEMHSAVYNVLLSFLLSQNSLLKYKNVSVSVGFL